MQHIIKRKGHEEPYQSDKVFYTTYAACLNASMADDEAQKTAKKVVKEIESWIKDKKTVSSDELFKEITKVLRNEFDIAAFMYETHRDIF